MLTRRQLQVLRAKCGGLLNKQIGAVLGICERTVKQHMHTLYCVSLAKTEAQLGAWAAHNGYLDESVELVSVNGRQGREYLKPAMDSAS
jgi:DNA-binding NarL/FixJ family response regulator